MNINQTTQPTLPPTKVQAGLSTNSFSTNSSQPTPGQNFSFSPKKKFDFLKTKKNLLIVVALFVLFGIGAISILITQKQYQQPSEPVAPNAPESEPAAYYNGRICSLQFSITDVISGTPTPTGTLSPTPTATRTPTPTNTPTPSPTAAPNECAYTPCTDDDNCDGDLVCVEADNGSNYCSEPEYVIACRANPNYATCCTQPTATPTSTPTNTPTSTPTNTPTPTPMDCADTPCDSNNDCEDGLVCVEADDGNGYCSEVAYVAACQESPSYTSCCTQPTATPTPTATPAPNECGYTPCDDNDDCEGDLICVPTNDGVNYCSEVAYAAACQENPSYTTCCTAPVVVTSTPVPTSTVIVYVTYPPYATPLPTVVNQQQVYVVQTAPECNDVCSVNSDCANISHICYNGRCRLDVNPEDEYCRLPSGEVTVERLARVPEELPSTGPSDWLNYLKIGIGALGAGLLLLLFL